MAYDINRDVIKTKTHMLNIKGWEKAYLPNIRQQKIVTAI